MILTNSLKKANILIEPRSKNRWELINEMLELAVRNGEVDSKDREFLKSALIEREKSMSTGIGKGVAIPHCSTDLVNDIVIIMSMCRDGIDFDSVDGLPVRIAILLIVPKNKLTQHIKTLANIAKLMNNDPLREELFTLKSASQILKAIKAFEETAKK